MSIQEMIVKKEELPKRVQHSLEHWDDLNKSADLSTLPKEVAELFGKDFARRMVENNIVVTAERKNEDIIFSFKKDGGKRGYDVKLDYLKKYEKEPLAEGQHLGTINNLIRQIHFDSADKAPTLWRTLRDEGWAALETEKLTYSRLYVKHYLGKETLTSLDKNGIKPLADVDTGLLAWETEFYVVYKDDIYKINDAGMNAFGGKEKICKDFVEKCKSIAVESSDAEAQAAFKKVVASMEKQKSGIGK